MKEEIQHYIDSHPQWSTILQFLHQLTVDSGLEEAFKWRNPCYTDRDKNILFLFATKEYSGISFFKGVLLKDAENILLQPSENTQSMRQIRYTSLADAVKDKNTLSAYIIEATENEREGKKVITKPLSEYSKPLELIEAFEKDSLFERAFEKLSHGRQKAYILYFNQAKKSETRLKRIEKYQDRIAQGFGLRDCVCGLSKRMPNCDGSHKNT